ncbi:MAG: signal peptidase II [Rhodobacteraceae bacterium]|nr:signal peptidase II [Paracoccaceae bacterium]
MIRVLATTLLILILDQVSKWAIVRAMNLRNLGQIEVWPPFITFRMAWNQGVNFGLFANDTQAMRWVLIVLALAISGWIIHWSRGFTRPIAQISAGLVVGGALGNALDRVVYGAVADFLNMSCCGIANPYAFNVADAAIFAGAAGLILFAGKDDTGA